MAQQATAKTELFAQWSQGNLVIADQGKATGARFWVDSNTGSDTAGYGRSPSKPFATLAYAFSSDVCTANNGDIIYVMEGHAETVNAAADVVMDIAGVRVVGLGSGATRPTVTFSTADTADIDITAADITVENILFYCALDGLNIAIDLSGDDFHLINCEFRDSASTGEANVWLDASSAADRLVVDGLAYNGFIAGDACTAVLQLNGGTGCLVKNSRFYGQVSTGIVNMAANSYDVLIENSYFYNDSGALSLNVVDTGGSSTWAVTNCFDGKGGYSFSGSSTLAVAADDISAVTSYATTSSAAVSGLTSSFVVQSGAVSGVVSRLTAQSNAVSGLTSSFVSQSGAVSGLTSQATVIASYAVTSSTAASGLTSSFVVQSGAVSGLTSSFASQSGAVSGLTSSFVVQSGAVSGVTSQATIIASYAVTSSTAVSGLTSSFIVQSGAVSGLTSSFVVQSGAVSGLTSSFVTQSGAVSGLTSSFAIQSGAVSGLTSSHAVLSATLSTMLSMMTSGW